MDPIQYCRNITSKSGSSFYYSFLFLPKEQHDALATIYAFCRVIDDVVDECHDLAIAEKKLDWWQNEIDALFNHNPTHPITIAISKTFQVDRLPKICFDEMIAGMRMDLKYHGYETFDDLKVYCHCVASTVGILICHIFKFKDQQTLEFAKNLGIAFQLVNIIRDVGEDARRGRIYLPENDMEQFQLNSNDILDLKYSEPFINFMKSQCNLARQYYQTALNLLPNVDRPQQKCSLIMAEIYFSLLDEIEDLKFNVLKQKVKLTPLRKLWIAWQTHRREKKWLKKNKSLL